MDCNDRLFLAYLDEMNMITILLPLSYQYGLSSSFTLSNSHQKIPLKTIETSIIERYYKYICSFSDEFFFDTTYWITDEHGTQTDLQMGAVIRTTHFDKKFSYSGNDLGVSCEKSRTIFKLWAPTATQVKIKLRPPGCSQNELVEMKRGERGIWASFIERDLEFYQYSFLVCVNLEWKEAVDPYANAVTANGEHGVVIKLAKTRKPRQNLEPLEHPVDAVIYETHIRDFTIHPNSGVKNKGLYLGAGETDSKNNYGELTGLSYVKSLGITHIEFLPFNDFAGVDELNHTSNYNWGYNPLHYNVPEGSFSTAPETPYSRVIELKQMIELIHQQGLRVIMDVVYNHVYIRDQSSFEKIVPGYYFRHNEYGIPSNGTGVGNDLASERLMVRKFIIDSIRYWIEEYDVDGFRFDLMGILDVSTMNEVRTICDTLKKGIIILGEGWNLPTFLPSEEKATIINQTKIPGIAQFNDFFRDSIKGSTFRLDDKGYALGNEIYYDAAKEVLTGSIGYLNQESRFFNEPFQSVNYVENHDDHTMWDKLQICFPDNNETVLIKYHLLATCMVLLSQGIPFLHSGQEFLRTKYGIGNSYCYPDSVNQLDWDRKSKYIDNVNYIKGIIAIRKEYPCFRFRTASEIRRCMKALPMPKPVIGYCYQNINGKFREVLLLINPLSKPQTVKIPEREWYVIADANRATLFPFRKLESSEFQLDPVSIHIYVR